MNRTFIWYLFIFRVNIQSRNETAVYNNNNDNEDNPTGSRQVVVAICCSRCRLCPCNLVSGLDFRYLVWDQSDFRVVTESRLTDCVNGEDYVEIFFFVSRGNFPCIQTALVYVGDLTWKSPNELKRVDFIVYCRRYFSIFKWNYCLSQTY